MVPPVLLQCVVHGAHVITRLIDDFDFFCR